MHRGEKQEDGEEGKTRKGGEKINGRGGTSREKSCKDVYSRRGCALTVSMSGGGGGENWGKEDKLSNQEMGVRHKGRRNGGKSDLGTQRNFMEGAEK